MQNIGIFGGTFNPVHWGHLLIAETAVSQFALEKVIWVPTFCPPHKTQVGLEFEQRLELVRQATADHPLFEVSDVDGQRGGVSFAIDTLHDLQTLYPDSRWFWIVGIDAFQSIPKWRGHEELTTQCTWLVAPRNGVDVSELVMVENETMHPCCWHLLQMPLVEVSSSLIRHYRQQGRSIRYLVPETARLYITTHQLYK